MSSDASSLFHDIVKPMMVIVIVLLLALLASAALSGQLSSLRLMADRTHISTFCVGVYTDVNCSNPVYFFDWGIVEPHSVNNRTVFIRNEGNERASLFLTVESWSPTNAPGYLSLSWDYKGQELDPDEVVEVTFMLAVAPDSQGIGEFDFTMIIGVFG